MATKLNAGDVDRRDLFFIPPEEISACQEQNGRWQPHDETAVDEMVASYEQCGQLQPVIVRRIENNRVALVLGFRRWLAALQWNRFHPDKPMKLKCVLSALNDEEALSRNVIENRERKSTSPVDDAHNARRLTENYGWTDARVAELFRVSAGYLSQLKKLLTLPTDVQKRVHSGELSVATAVSLAALPKDEQAEVLSQIEPQPVTALEQVAVTDWQPDAAPAEQPPVQQPAAVKKGSANRTAAKAIREKKIAKGGKQRRTLAEVNEFFRGLTGPAEPEPLRDLANLVLDFTGGKTADGKMEKALKELLAGALTS